MIFVRLLKICLVGCAITFGVRGGIHLLQSTSEIHFHSCMQLCSGKRYLTEPVSEMSFRSNRTVEGLDGGVPYARTKVRRRTTL